MRADRASCPQCMQVNDHGHDDDCSDRAHHRTVRHNIVKGILVSALRRVKGTQVVVEPLLEANSHRRTDWRVHGTAAEDGSSNTDYDITFISTTNLTARRAPDRAQHEQQIALDGMRKAATNRLQAYLDAKAKTKIDFYAGATPTALIPLVFSFSGAEHPAVTKTFKHWRSIMPSFSYVTSCISVVLARTRAETFHLV